MKKIIVCLFALFLVYQVGCDVLDSQNEENLSEIQLNLNNMPPLKDSSYVGWLTRIVDEPDSINFALKFFRLKEGSHSENAHAELEDLHNANSFIVTIEPDSVVDSSLTSSRVYMYGRIFNGAAALNYVAKDREAPNPLPTGEVKLLIDIVK